MKVKFEAMESPNLSGVVDENGKSARMVGKFKSSKVKTIVDVNCLPLFTLLAALDFPTVDFFSLDVEGAELGILQTIPWNQVNIVFLSLNKTLAPAYLILFIFTLPHLGQEIFLLKKA